MHIAKISYVVALNVLYQLRNEFRTCDIFDKKGIQRCKVNINDIINTNISNKKLNFSTVFTKIIKRFIKRGYDPIILRHTACLVFNPFTVGHYAFLF
jgi:hypothetical protein